MYSPYSMDPDGMTAAPEAELLERLARLELENERLRKELADMRAALAREGYGYADGGLTVRVRSRPTPDYAYPVRLGHSGMGPEWETRFAFALPTAGKR